ncbi:MAG: D-alanyl-D-alanine carboxypeptidase [Acetobacteraceae bacterium]|nr:D-alanyl-D-alanine carboxypeptidase [Acetobacteraceae bacterium]
MGGGGRWQWLALVVMLVFGAAAAAAAGGYPARAGVDAGRPAWQATLAQPPAEPPAEPRARPPAQAPAEAAPAASAAGPSPGFELKSRSALLMDAGSGRVLLEKNPHERLAPASLTKIMTLALIFEALEANRTTLDDQVVASEEASSLEGSGIWLEPGETMSMRDVIAAIAIASANDASAAACEHLFGSQARAVEVMNQRAQELGLKDTHFANTHGLDQEGHYTSAYDVAVTSRHALRFPRMLDFTSKWEEYLRGGRLWLVNTNRLIHYYPGVDGLKTGSTDKAGFCVSATCRRDNTRLIAVIMAAPDSATRFNEAMRLLNWGFANFSSVPVLLKDQPADRVRVAKGVAEFVEAGVKEDFYVTVRKGEEAGLERRLELAQWPQAPIQQGQKLGEIIVVREGQELGRADLVAVQAVPRLGLGGMLSRVLAAVIGFFR